MEFILMLNSYFISDYELFLQEGTNDIIKYLDSSEERRMIREASRKFKTKFYERYKETNFEAIVKNPAFYIQLLTASKATINTGINLEFVVNTITNLKIPEGQASTGLLLLIDFLLFGISVKYTPIILEQKSKELADEISKLTSI